MRPNFLLARVAAPVLLGALTLAGCTPEQTLPAPSTGSLDLSRLIAVGDNYLSGYSEGGLTRKGQQYSIPALLDQQFALAAGRTSTFTQPLMPEGIGSGYLQVTGFDALGTPQTRRVVTGRATAGRPFFANAAACGGPDTVFLYARAAGQTPQNLAVPGLRLSQTATLGLGNEANLKVADRLNPFFERLLPPADSRSYLQVVTDASPSATFFVFSAGLADVLPYVLSGGECAPVPTATIINNSPAQKLLDKLRLNNRPGIIALAPSLATLPLIGRGSSQNVSARLGKTDSVFVRSSPANVVRPLDARDYLMPTGLAMLGATQTVQTPTGPVTARYGLDRRNPLSRRDVLDYREYGIADAALGTLNEELGRLAKSVYKIPAINQSSSGVNIFQQIAQRITINGVTYGPEPVRGNFYSADQFSLTPRGNAIVTNALITEINRFYGSTIPLLDPNTYPTSSRP